MKLTFEEFKTLASKHISQLTLDEMNALAFLLDYKISKYKKTEWFLEFKLTSELQSVFVQCHTTTNCEIGRTKKRMTSWGGVFSFAHVISTSRAFFFRGYQLTMQSAEKREIYSDEEWKQLVLECNDYILKS